MSSRNLREIYERISIQAKQNNIRITEQELRRKAWMERDRFIFESSAGDGAGAGSGGAGGGSGNRRESTVTPPTIIEFANSYIITWVDINDDLWKISVFNFDRGELSETINTNLTYNNGDLWYLDRNYHHIQNGGFSISYRNNNDNKYKIYFLNTNGEIKGIKEIDTNEDFHYTENAQGYLGLLNSISTFYHFTNESVYTHQLDGINIESIEIDDASGDDVTSDGSMIVEAPVDQKFYIARPDGKLVEITEYMMGQNIRYRIDYNTNFIPVFINDDTINIISQEGTLLNTLELPSSETYELLISGMYGENCVYYEINVNDADYSYIVAYDGDDNRFITTTQSSSLSITTEIAITKRSWVNPVSSFGKTLFLCSFVEKSLGAVGLITDSVEMQWLPKGSNFFHREIIESTDMLFILGNSSQNSNLSFTQGENPIIMFATASHINVGFLTNNGLISETTGITASSCTNIISNNMGEKTFAVFDIVQNDTQYRVWQIYGNSSIEHEIYTTPFWQYGSGGVFTNRNGTLCVIDQEEPTSSFYYTPITGIQPLPVIEGSIYNEIEYGNRTGISSDYQLIFRKNLGEIEGFYILSINGLSDFVNINLPGYSENKVMIGESVISIGLTNMDGSRYLLYDIYTLDLLHDTNNIQVNNSIQYGDRTILEQLDGNDKTIMFIHKSGVDSLNISQSTSSYSINDSRYVD